MENLSVILFEDDPIIHWDLSTSLTKLNYDVKEHYESSDEININEKKSMADVIITNLKLADGWVDDTFLESLSSLAHRVIVLTGLGDISSINTCAIKGPHLLLIKPFTKVQLKTCLGKLASLE